MKPLLSQKTLAEDWLKPEEDEAWAHSQTEQIAETKEHRFDDLFGIIKTVSLEEIEQAIALQGVERFNDCFDRENII